MLVIVGTRTDAHFLSAVPTCDGQTDGRNCCIDIVLSIVVLDYV